MDYDFVTDPIQQYVARCSMEHCAMGYWLTAEVGANAKQISTLLNAIERIQQRRSWEFELDGSEYSLQLSPEQALVRANALCGVNDPDHDEHEPFGGEMDYFDAESSAHCGLDDFKALLIDWQRFVGCSPP
ncbi:MAG: YacL family protein [Motiliproteus sp.]